MHEKILHLITISQGTDIKTSYVYVRICLSISKIELNRKKVKGIHMAIKNYELRIKNLWRLHEA